jgi:hypothetical protein
MTLRRDENDLSSVKERLKGHKLKSFTDEGNIKFFEVLDNFTNYLYNYSIDEAARNDQNIVDDNHVDQVKLLLYHPKKLKKLEWKEVVSKELLIPIGIGLLFVSTSIILEMIVGFLTIHDFTIAVLCVTLPTLGGAALLVAGIFFRLKLDIEFNP